MKRMSDMEGEAPMKRSRNSGDGELRLLIQSKAAGSIIGKGGANITRMRKENSASITVPDCPGPERVLTIGGADDVVMKVLEEVLESMEDNAQREDEYDVRVLVHQSQAGAIIGKGGSKIKELRELSGGQVKVFSNCCPNSTERIIQIIGDRSMIVSAVGSVQQTLNDTPVKGINSPYNPHNFDEFYAQDYGGWSDVPKGGGRFPGMGGGRGPPPMGGRGPMGGMGGPSGMGGGPFGGRRGGGGGGGGPPFMGGGGRGPMHDDFDHGGRGGGGGGLMNGGNNDGDVTTTQVTIPRDAAGAIIGKGGSRIRKIRGDSCASISIEDSRPGSNDRIITITGSDHQIKHAQYLLQQSVREHFLDGAREDNRDMDHAPRSNRRY